MLVRFIFALFAFGLFAELCQGQEKIVMTADFRTLDPDTSKSVGIGVNFLSDSPEMADTLKELKVSCIRYATAEYTLFRTGTPNQLGVAIPDRSLWPVEKFTDNKKWYSKLSFDQFIALCRETKAEPCVVLPIDAMIYTGSAQAATADEVVQAAADWVRYANVTRGYKVQHWEIGNESDIVTNPHVKWTPEKYAEATIQLSKAMKAVDPSIQIGVNGMRMGKTLPWWDEVLPAVANDIDFAITHQYSWLPSYDQWRVDPSRYDYNVTDAETALEKHKLNLPLFVTEVSGFNPSMKQPHSAWKALHSFEVIGNVLTHRRVDSAFFWTSKWLGKNDLSDDTNALTKQNELTPMGRTLAIWAQNANGDIAQCPDRSGARAWYSRDKNGNAAIFVLNRGSHAVEVTVKTIGLASQTKIAESQRWESESPESTRLIRVPMKVELSRPDEVIVPLPPLSLGVVKLVE